MARTPKNAPAPIVAEDMIPVSAVGTVHIGSKTYTVSRAVALGLVARVSGGIGLTDAGRSMGDSQSAKAAEREARARDWRRKQGLEPETTEDGRLKRTRKPQPLMPKNVTPDGVPVEDDETLAQIEERTAAIEAAHLAELADAGDSDG